MKKFLRVAFAVMMAGALVSLATLSLLDAQDTRIALMKRAAESILGSDIHRDVSVIASDANMGRATPSPGFDSAAAYIARTLRQLGIKPMGDKGTYFQHYTVTRSILDTNKASGAIGNRAMKWGIDFYISSFLVPGVREANVIYVGNGVRSLKNGIDPYAGFDIRGKWVLVNSGPLGQPLLATGERASTLGKLGVDYTTVREEAKLRGAIGILLAPNPPLLNAWNSRATTGRDLNPSVGWAYSQYQVPRVVLSIDATRRLLEGTRVSATDVLNADSTLKYPTSQDLGAAHRVKINFAAKTSESRPYNVVGLLEGSDPELRDEWVSLAAHLDGAVGGGARDGDSIYNAADDNGSGSAGNMAIARALVAGPRPKRSILLIWDSGEEVGLWGTRTIAYGPLADKLVAHLSNDMIGRTKAPGSNNPGEQNLAGPGEVYITGPLLLSRNLEATLQRSLSQFPYAKANRKYEDVSSEFFYPRTDAGPYLERGIPIVQFFTGLHADYHLQGDEVSKLDPAKMEAISRQSYVTLWMIADDPVKPRWDLPVPSTLWWVTPRR